MRRYRRSMWRRRRSARRYRRGVFSDCGVGVTPQMCNRVTNHGETSTFSRPALLPLAPVCELPLVLSEPASLPYSLLTTLYNFFSCFVHTTTASALNTLGKLQPTCQGYWVQQLWSAAAAPHRLEIPSHRYSVLYVCCWQTMKQVITAVVRGRFQINMINFQIEWKSIINCNLESLLIKSNFLQNKFMYLFFYDIVQITASNFN